MLLLCTALSAEELETGRTFINGSCCIHFFFNMMRGVQAKNYFMITISSFLSKVGVLKTNYFFKNFVSLDFAAIGTSAGWLYPISRLIRDQFIVVEECNAIVKAASTFFKQMCLPGALTSFYNPFGKTCREVMYK